MVSFMVIIGCLKSLLLGHLLFLEKRYGKGGLKMDMEDFLDFCKNGNPISGEDKELHGLLTQCSYEAQRITMGLNTSYHSREEIIEIFTELTGTKVDSSFMCFPPFYTDFGKNITIGKNVFFNTGCSFQDRGGISIGDGSMIGMNVTIATLNHGLSIRNKKHNIPLSSYNWQERMDWVKRNNTSWCNDW